MIDLIITSTIASVSYSVQAYNFLNIPNYEFNSI